MECNMNGEDVMEMNTKQVKSILKYIDALEDENIREKIYCKLGEECFHSRNVKQWIESFDGDIQKFLDRVNVEHASPYWEKLEFNPEKTVLSLTGKEVDRCVCAFGHTEDPPRSLCEHCCKTFQENMFQALFKKRVHVEITASAIYGDGRCDTRIYIEEC